MSLETPRLHLDRYWISNEDIWHKLYDGNIPKLDLIVHVWIWTLSLGVLSWWIWNYYSWEWIEIPRAKDCSHTRILIKSTSSTFNPSFILVSQATIFHSSFTSHHLSKLVIFFTKLNIQFIHLKFTTTQMKPDS